MKLVVDSHIHLPTGAFDDGQLARLKRSVTIRNPDKRRAAREKVWGWKQMPDELIFWEIQPDHSILLPRGIANQMDKIAGTEVYWVDQRVEVSADTSLWLNPILHDYQEEAVLALLSHEQGVYEAPTGSGKTVALLELIRRAGQRSLVIVNNTHIALQWCARAAEHLGLSTGRIGLIGNDQWVEHDLTIAMQQTLWMRRDSLEGWWETWGLVALDECHHVPAETFFDVFQRFPSRYRLGVSATPDKQEGRERMVDMAIGPTVCVTPLEKLRKEGRIDTPRVKIVPTEFKFAFWPTHRSKKVVDDEGNSRYECDVDDCDRKGLVHRNNYQDLVRELINDDGRNDIVAHEIASAYMEGRAVLVLSRRLGHLADLRARVAAIVGGDEDLLRLTSKEKDEVRMAIYGRAEQGHCVIFSTIGDEALDIPRLDTLVLPFPSKQTGLIVQQIGRISRMDASKAPALVVDFEDPVGVLWNQLAERGCAYRKLGLEVL